MKKFAHIIVALSIGLMIGMTSNAIAAPVKEYVQASFQKINFIVNGEEKTLDSDPLVYQGSTYLPVRTVLNALGYDVGYKADTKTVTADKALETIISEANTLVKNGGDPMESTLENTPEIDKKIETLKTSITRRQEMITTVQSMIKDTESRSDVPEDVKKQKIDEYKSIIEYSENLIQTYESQLAELQK